jgi:signal transduction histidine kinase
MSNAAKLLKDQQLLIPQNAPVPNRKILVVDDEPEIAQGILQILSPENSSQVVSITSSRQKTQTTPSSSPSEFSVTVVNSPEQALHEAKRALASGTPYAMGFFDVMLGAKIDGIELVNQLMQLDPNLFAVFVTAYHDRSVDAIGNYLGEECRERWDYINKPFTEGEILQKARNATSLWDLNRLKHWQSERLSEAHQLLLASEKQNAVAAIGRSVAHEFGNLLTHIIGHAEIAKYSDDMTDMKNSIDVILKAGNTAANVLKNFRNLNESHDYRDEKTLCHIQQPLDEALELMEFRFRRHRIQIKKNILSPVQLEINRSSMVQVFANLFINAIHAMPEGGQIDIEIDQDQDDCKIKVRDVGAGIPEALLSRVLDPLFTTKGKDGSGLGLPICKEIIEIEHRGRFSLSNHPDGGLLVQISLPLREE